MNPNSQDSSRGTSTDEGGQRRDANAGTTDADLSSTIKSSTVPSTPTVIPPAAPFLPPAKIRHEWFQNENFVTVSVFIKNTKKEDVSIDYSPRAISVTVKLASGSDFMLELDPLAHPIVPEESKHSILGSKIEIKLKKEVVGIQWGALEGQDATITHTMNAKKNWDAVAKSVEDEKPEGEAALNALFQQIYKDADENTRRAMMKSYVESNGTCLSTNWAEVGKGKVETSPPEGMIAKKALVLWRLMKAKHFRLVFIAIAVGVPLWAIGTPLLSYFITLPIYFQVLVLSNLGLWCWASNVHCLEWAGIDVSWLLLGAAEYDSNKAAECHHPVDSKAATNAAVGAGFASSQTSSSSTSMHPNLTISIPISSRVGGPSRTGGGATVTAVADLSVRNLYLIAAAHSAVTLASILLFAMFVQSWGEESTESIPSVGDLQIVFTDLVYNIPAHDENRLVKALTDPPHHRRSIVRRDGYDNVGEAVGTAWVDFIAPILICLPFLFRLRQCIAEFLQTRDPSAKNRHMLNAIKYLSAIPVIISSWLINYLRIRYYGLGLDASKFEGQSEGFMEMRKAESKINFSIGVWIFFSILNSIYSLYWDICMDWHLGTINKNHLWKTFFDSAGEAGSYVTSPTFDSTFSSAANSTSTHQQRRLAKSSSAYAKVSAEDKDLEGEGDVAYEKRGIGRSSKFPTAPGSPTGGQHGPSAATVAPKSYPPSVNKTASSLALLANEKTIGTKFFLRPHLHFRYALLYYLAIILDTILRLSWIVKVTLIYTLASASLRGQTGAELVSRLMAVDFSLKCLEILRRYVWVFFRCEREWVVKRGHIREDPIREVRVPGDKWLTASGKLLPSVIDQPTKKGHWKSSSLTQGSYNEANRQGSLQCGNYATRDPAMKPYPNMRLPTLQKEIKKTYFGDVRLHSNDTFRAMPAMDRNIHGLENMVVQDVVFIRDNQMFEEDVELYMTIHREMSECRDVVKLSFGVENRVIVLPEDVAFGSATLMHIKRGSGKKIEAGLFLTCV
ncbi:hypothetical protein HDU67_003489 [Dinochytrium kinnereticum]|nr:hypothetical protein HDU67_003489 [Dinochytrium kinnereticum]